MSQPPSAEASATDSPVSSVIKVGRMGMMIPKPMTSMSSVINIKMMVEFEALFMMQINEGRSLGLMHICGKS